MNELSLFSGAGGGLLGTKLLGFKNIGYVEYEEYCQKIIKQRIEDGILDAAPIFGDIKRFISEGYAKSYQGMVDVITAGFPCQPFSVAGRGQAENDERNMWPATIECIRIIRPRYAFLENVPGLLVHGYIRRIFGDLAQAGYNAKWCVLGADDCGAPHRRKRLWILAYSNTERLQRRDSAGLQECIDKRITWSSSTWWEEDPAELSNPNKRGLQKTRPEQQAAGVARSIQRANGSAKPELGRVVNGISNRVDRLKAIGNGQVPAVVQTVWRILIK